MTAYSYWYRKKPTSQSLAYGFLEVANNKDARKWLGKAANIRKRTIDSDLYYMLTFGSQQLKRAVYEGVTTVQQYREWIKDRGRLAVVVA